MSKKYSTYTQAHFPPKKKEIGCSLRFFDYTCLFHLVCPPEPNVLAIILGVVIGLVVAGILFVVGVKFGIDFKDWREYQAFLLEVKKAKWESVRECFRFVWF